MATVPVVLFPATGTVVATKPQGRKHIMEIILIIAVIWAVCAAYERYADTRQGRR